VDLDILRALDSRSLGRRLQQARRARGLTQEQVAEHLSVARTTVTAIEKGERRVRPEELVQLAGLYGRAVGEFLRISPPGEPFRVQLRAQLAPADDVDDIVEQSRAELERLAEDYRELERLCNAPLPQRFPDEYRFGASLPPETFGEDVANHERLRLGLGDGPLPNLRETLEAEVGLRIFYFDMPSKLAALFAFTDELGGCIGVNAKHPSERRRVSLAHDYAHVLVSRYQPEVTWLGRHVRVPRIERVADAFARVFLMPSSGLRRRAGDLRESRGGALTPADVCILADLYLVSFEAMTRRLEELKIVSMGTWERLQQKRFSPREARELLGLPSRESPDEMLPVRYRVLAVEAYERGDLSEGQLARFLHVDRLRAREIVERLQTDVMVSDQGESGVLTLDLGASLGDGNPAEE